MDNSLQDEYFDIVDENNKIIGKALRQDCHKNPQLIHRSVHVLVFNSKGELYLQKRSLLKDVQPGKWDTSVGGHLLIGEDYLTAAHREMKEELGIEITHLTYLYDYPMRNNLESENVRTYLARSDESIIPDPVEISEGRFFTIKEIDSLVGTDFFTPNFEEEYDRYLIWKKMK